MRKLIVLLAMFVFIYPVFPKHMPIPLDRTLQIIGFGLLAIQRREFIKLISNKNVLRFFSVTLLLTFLSTFALLQNSSRIDLYFLKEVISTYFHFFSVYLIYRCFLYAYKDFDLGIVLYYIVLVGILQTVISFVFFINPYYFDIYIDFIKEETNQGLLMRLGSLDYRFIGVGSQFFSGSIKYGIVLFSALILPYVYNGVFVKNKFIYWSSILFISIGGLLTGRTYFVAISLGVLMLVIIESKSILRFIVINLKVVTFILLATLIIVSVGYYSLNQQQFDRIVNFVFELFLNLSSGDGLSSSSTDTLINMYVFPDSLKTWLVGDGLITGATGGYYMSTDVGFLRLIYYFGLPSTLIFIYVYYKYYIITTRLFTKEYKVFLKIITLWFLILNFKGLVMETRFYVLFLVIAVLMNRRNYYFRGNIKIEENQK